MFDNICTLPLPSDIFTQALHPTLPILSVGLISGHVHTYQLPSETSHSTNGSTTKEPTTNGTTKPQPRRNSGTGFDTVDTLWSTRRHKDSVRSLAFSTSGTTLFSAGADCLIKCASTKTGRVHFKVLCPLDKQNRRLPEMPSVICVLSPQALLLGTDVGAVHVYELKTVRNEEGEELLVPNYKPAASYRPHVTEEEPNFREAITSLTALPPRESSSSGTSRMWISTAGSSVAVCDVRKGVVACSVDQGDVVLSSCCSGARVGKGGLKRKAGQIEGGEEKICVGGNGVLTLWERGDMVDRKGSVVVQRDAGGLRDESTIDCMIGVPPDVLPNTSLYRNGIIAVGLGNGAIKFVRLKGRGGDVVGGVGHDELDAEGVVTLGFDVEGRMISGGGQNVKIWHPTKEVEAADGETVNGEDEDVEEIIQMGDGSDDDSDDSGSDSDEAPKKRKKKKRRKNLKVTGKFGEHGVLAFSGLE